MAKIPMSKLGFILQSLNHNFRYRVGQGRSAMLYLYQPRNIQAGVSESGLLDVCAFPSPIKYPYFPKFDFIDYTGRKSRGYAKFFQILAEQKLVSPGKLSEFVSDWADQPPKTYVSPIIKPKLNELDMKTGLPKGFQYSGR